MARPSFKPTREQRKLVHSLAAIGLTQGRIAVAVGIRSPKTLRKHFARDLAKGDAQAMVTLTATAQQMAVSGKFPGMTMFWLNTVGRAPAMPPDDPGRDQSEDFC